MPFPVMCNFSASRVMADGRREKRTYEQSSECFRRRVDDIGVPGSALYVVGAV